MKRKGVNKNNLIKVFSLLIIIGVFIPPLILAPSLDSSELISIEPVDGTVNLEAQSGEITVTSEFSTIKTAGGTIPNVQSGNLVVENGNPVSGKLFFSADSSFDLDDKHITVPKDGSIEFKDGKIIVSKDTTIEVDDTELAAELDGTEIKIEKETIEIKGKVFIDYETIPAKIKLIGEGSSVELQTDDDEKFEFKNSDGEELIINIGSFSEDCNDKNCISYQEIGVGKSTEEWNRLNVDGNAIITKTVITKSEDGKETEETIYKIKFKNGRATLYRDLSKLEGTTFSEKTVINYNSEDITLFIEISEKRAEEIDKDRVDIAKGSTNVRFYDEFYDNKDVQLSISSAAIFGDLTQGQMCQGGICPPPSDWTQN